MTDRQTDRKTQPARIEIFGKAVVGISNTAQRQFMVIKWLLNPKRHKLRAVFESYDFCV